MYKYSFFAQVTNIETSRDVLKLIAIRYHKEKLLNNRKKINNSFGGQFSFFEKQQRSTLTSTVNLGYASTAGAGI